MRKRVKNIKRRNLRYRRLKIFLICVIIAIIIFAVLLYKLYPIVIRYAESVAETIMLNSANDAIIEVLEKNNVTYDDIVRLETTDEGYVRSLEIDIYEINRLKSCISNTTASLVDSKEHYKVEIPIGTFLGNTYTQGLGPKCKFNMHLTSTAFVDFTHEFRSAGINQALHIIKVKIDIKGSFVMAGYTKSINASTSAIAAQTVIVGKTPDAFTNVIESEGDNTGGLINDYGAIIG